MNPHYHPYGATELTSPHPPSPDNNNYHGGGGGNGGGGGGGAGGGGGGANGPTGPQHGTIHGGPPSGGGGGGPMSNGHMGVSGGPPPPSHHMLGGGPGGNGAGAEIHTHPAFSGANGPLGPHHHHHHHHHHQVNNNNNTVKVCAGCGGKIMERFLLHALDRYWHNGCLKCSCCAAMLADMGSSCFTKSGMILCKADYMRLFGNSGACSACGQTIPASEFVMRAGVPQQPGAPPQHHVFHLKCFACSQCGAHLVPGDRYYMLSGKLVCEQDWHKLLKTNTTGTVRKGKVGRPRRSRD